MEKIRKKIFEMVKNEYEGIEKKKFIPGKTRVPVSGRTYDYTDINSLIDSALDFWLTTGRFNASFEEKLSKIIKVKNVSTCNSGSSANLLAFSSLTSHLLKNSSLKPGDEVITLATSFPTTVNPILQHNCTPVFIDIDIPTYNIDCEKIEGAISKKTRAISIAHTLGNPCNLDKVLAITKKYNLFFIEDCCDALGSQYDGKHVGSFGDIGTLSFYPAHHITMGEGGAVFTNRTLLNKAIRSIRDWGRDCWCETGCDNTCGVRFNWKAGDLPHGYDHKYIYSHLGYNLKITDMQASVGLAQIKHLNKFIKSRKANFSKIYNNLKDLEEFIILPQATDKSDPSWFGFPISLRKNKRFTRKDLLEFLTKSKIDTRLLFAGNITKQPYMKNRKFRVPFKLPNTDFVMNNTFWLGTFPGINDSMIDYMSEHINQFFKKNL